MVVVHEIQLISSYAKTLSQSYWSFHTQLSSLHTSPLTTINFSKQQQQQQVSKQASKQEKLEKPHNGASNGWQFVSFSLLLLLLLLMLPFVDVETPK